MNPNAHGTRFHDWLEAREPGPAPRTLLARSMAELDREPRRGSWDWPISRSVLVTASAVGVIVLATAFALVFSAVAPRSLPVADATASQASATSGPTEAQTPSAGTAAASASPSPSVSATPSPVPTATVRPVPTATPEPHPIPTPAPTVDATASPTSAVTMPTNPVCVPYRGVYGSVRGVVGYDYITGSWDSLTAQADLCVTIMTLGAFDTVGVGTLTMTLDGTPVFVVDLALWEDYGVDGASSGDQVMVLEAPMWLYAGQTLALDHSACTNCETDSVEIVALTP